MIAQRNPARSATLKRELTVPVKLTISNEHGKITELVIFRPGEPTIQLRKMLEKTRDDLVGRVQILMDEAEENGEDPSGVDHLHAIEIAAIELVLDQLKDDNPEVQPQQTVPQVT